LFHCVHLSPFLEGASLPVNRSEPMDRTEVL